MTSDHKALLEVVNASERWIAAFNQGNVQQCADQYLIEAQMVAEPFGRFHGRDEIHQFWAELVSQGANNLEYRELGLMQQPDGSVMLTADWSMNIGSGIVTREHWVKHDGRWMFREDRFAMRRRC